MDPLSVTASAVAVIQAAGFLTTTIHKFVQSIRTADTRISALCSELSSLQSYLDSVQNILDECRSRKLAPLQPDLWQRCDESLKDCLVTLSLLEALVNKIKDSTPARGKGLRWRARVAIDMSIHGDALAEFHERIQKSNIALQTMLHTIALFLSLKNDASQDKILFELEQLKCSFQAALQASLRSERAGRSDARISHNLHNLATAARQFHSAASSSSEASKSSNHGPGSLHALSLMGDFPEHKRLQVEAFVKDGALSSAEFVEYHPETRLASTSPIPSDVGSYASLIAPAPLGGMLQRPPKFTADEDDEAEYEREYFDGLEDLARDRIVNGAYTKAIEFLNEAARRYADADPACARLRNIQAQLALCHFLQGNWKVAEPIVLSLSSVVDEVSCNLLHALSLAHLSEYSLDAALETCQKAVYGKKRLLKCAPAALLGHAQYDSATTVALYANIHHMNGDPIRAEIFHKRLPQGFEYEHPSGELEFIVKHPRFLWILLGNDVPTFLNTIGKGQPCGVSGRKEPILPRTHQPVMRCNEGGEFVPSPLRTRFADFTRYEDDTCKEAVAGPIPCSPADSGIDMTFSDDVSPTDKETERSIPSPANGNASNREMEPDSTSRRSLGRRFTRAIAAKQPQHRTTDSEAIPSVPNAPEAAVTPTSRWPRLGSYFGIAKSSEAQPKGPNEAAQESAITATELKRSGSKRLRDIVVTVKNAPNIKQASQWLRGKGFSEASTVVWPSKDASQFMTSSVPATTSLGGYTTANSQPPLRCSEALAMPERNVESKIVQDGLAAGFSVAGTMDKHFEMADTGRGFQLSDTCLTPVGIFDKWEALHGWYASSLPSTSASESRATSEAHYLTVDVNKLVTNQYCSPGSQSPSRTGDDDLASYITEQIPSRLAAILMLLPDASRNKKQAIIKPKLKALLRDVEIYLHDPMLAQDLRSIIASISDKPAHRKTYQQRDSAAPHRESSLFDQDLNTFLLNISTSQLPLYSKGAHSESATQGLQHVNNTSAVATMAASGDAVGGDKDQPTSTRQVLTSSVVESHRQPTQPQENRQDQPTEDRSRSRLSRKPSDVVLDRRMRKQVLRKQRQYDTSNPGNGKYTTDVKLTLRPALSFKAGDDTRFWSAVKAMQLRDGMAAGVVASA